MTGIYRVYFGNIYGLADKDVYANDRQDAINRAFILSASAVLNVNWTAVMVRAAKANTKVDFLYQVGNISSTRRIVN